jgi:phage tail-like protein
MGYIQVTQTSSLARIQTDPIRNFKFVVNITPPAGGAISVGFMSVSGLSVTVSVIAYRDGSMNTVTQKLPGQADFSPIVLSRGLAVGTQYELAWLKQLFQVMQGTAAATSDDTTQFPNGPGSEFRATVDVQILGHPVTGYAAPINAWFRVYNAWPTSVSYSDLDAGANQILVSQMTLAHEGWDLKVGTNVTTGVSF